MGRAMAVKAFGSILVLVALSAAVVPRGESSPVPAIFVFGDSTVDVGNNNYLTGKKVEKANFKPYGIDYPKSQPTGRFSNGYNIIDFIAKFVGFEESPPAHLAQRNKISRYGANFASAGSGVLASTGTTLSMTMQIQHFESHKAKMVAQIGEAATMGVLDYSLFVISTGSNDVFKFYKRPFNSRSGFIESVASEYTEHVSRLYNLGARKFVIFNVGMIGCCPFSRSLNPYGECIEDLNELAQSVNSAIKSVMAVLGSTLEWLYYSYARTYEVMSILIESPPKGLEVKSACCGEGKKRCSPGTAICSQRDMYLFWDMLHLTEKVAQVAGKLFFNGSNYYTSPINIKGLVELYLQ